MSMYTQLLDAAVGQRGPDAPLTTKHGALDALRHRRRDLIGGVLPATDPDAVPVMLAREIAYDLALLELAELMGIGTDLLRFEQPWQERARLEEALRERGVTTPPSAPPPTDAGEPARSSCGPEADGAFRSRWPRCATPGSIAR
jgi:hypothetical protein